MVGKEYVNLKIVFLITDFLIFCPSFLHFDLLSSHAILFMLSFAILHFFHCLANQQVPIKNERVKWNMQCWNKTIANQIIPTPEENVPKPFQRVRKWSLQGRPEEVWQFLEVTNKIHEDFCDYDADLYVYCLYSSINLWITKGTCYIHKNLGRQEKEMKILHKILFFKAEEHTQVHQQKFAVVFSTTGMSPLTLSEI